MCSPRRPKSGGALPPFLLSTPLPTFLPKPYADRILPKLSFTSFRTSGFHLIPQVREGGRGAFKELLKKVLFDRYKGFSQIVPGLSIIMLLTYSDFSSAPTKLPLNTIS